MNKHLLLLFLFTATILLSCSKNMEDRLIGSWELRQAWRQELFGRDYFQTGYENGVFTFSENGDATYIGNGDTLTGFWRADRYTRTNYNNGSGEYETRGGKYLRISLANVLRNIRLEWDFDDFRFRDNWQEIRAEQFSLSNDRIYEFQRR